MALNGFRRKETKPAALEIGLELTEIKAKDTAGEATPLSSSTVTVSIPIPARRLTHWDRYSQSAPTTRTDYLSSTYIPSFLAATTDDAKITTAVFDLDLSEQTQSDSASASASAPAPSTVSSAAATTSALASSVRKGTADDFRKTQPKEEFLVGSPDGVHPHKYRYNDPEAHLTKGKAAKK